MPYKGENASKLGHLGVLESDLINQILDDFENPEITNDDKTPEKNWKECNRYHSNKLQLFRITMK